MNRSNQYNLISAKWCAPNNICKCCTANKKCVFLISMRISWVRSDCVKYEMEATKKNTSIDAICKLLASIIYTDIREFLFLYAHMLLLACVCVCVWVLKIQFLVFVKPITGPFQVVMHIFIMHVCYREPRENESAEQGKRKKNVWLHQQPQ